MNVVEIVDKLAAFGYVRPSKVSGNYYQIHCPFHNNGNERRPSCGVLLHDEYKNGSLYKEGWFHCFACGHAGSLQDSIDKILKDRGVNQTGLDWLKMNVPDFEDDSESDDLIPKGIMDQIASKYALNYIQERTSDEPARYITEEELAKYRFVVPYMYERKLTDEIISAYDVGYDAEWIPPGRTKKVPCITFPVRDKFGRTMFLCRRSIQGKMYNYPDGVTKPLYGIDMIPKGTSSLIICESCINALTAVSYGYPAVALLGTGNPYQVKQLKELGMKEFIICCDGDEAGRIATGKLMRALKSVAIIWVIDMPDGKDLNDCTKEEFDKLFENRR